MGAMILRQYHKPQYSSTSDIWDATVWASKGLGNSTSALLSAEHTPWLIGLDRLHFTLSTVLGRTPAILESLKSWNLLCLWGFSFTSGLSEPFWSNSKPATRHQASTALHGPFMPSNQNHTLTSSTARPTCQHGSPDSQFLCSECEKILPRRFHLKLCWSLINHNWFSSTSWLTSIVSVEHKVSP